VEAECIMEQGSGSSAQQKRQQEEHAAWSGRAGAEERCSAEQ